MTKDFYIPLLVPPRPPRAVNLCGAHAVEFRQRGRLPHELSTHTGHWQ